MSAISGTGSPSAGESVPVCYRHRQRETWIRCQRCDRPICPNCMVSAAVGYQCPECVRQGRKDTRQGVGAYGGRLTGSPRTTTLALIGANVVVWLAVTLSGGAVGRLANTLALLPQGQTWAFPDGSIRHVRGVADGAWWQLLTNAFTHIEVWHIAMNMLSLFVLGPPLEMVLGRLRFLGVYLVSALTASAAVMVLGSPGSQTVGASGAICGLLGALVVVALKHHLDTSQLLAWVALTAFISVAGSGSISWQGHLGGFVGGILAAAGIVYAPRARRTPAQAAALLLIVALAVGLVAWRVSQLSATPQW